MGVTSLLKAAAALALLGLASSASAAGAYACRDASGRLTIQEDACPKGSTGKLFGAAKARPSHGKLVASAKPAARPRRTSSARTQIAVCSQLWKERNFLDQARRGPDAALHERDLKRIDKALCDQDCQRC